MRSPLEVTFPLPTTGVVQRVAAGLFAKFQAGALTGRDQHEARFVLDVIADWEDLDQELRKRIFQRLNIYVIVAAHGWPTAIAASTASTPNTICVLPPGVLPVQQIDNSSPRVRLNEVEGGRQTDQRQPQQRHQLRHSLHAVVEGAANRSFPNFLPNFNCNLILKLTGPLHLYVPGVLHLALCTILLLVT